MVIITTLISIRSIQYMYMYLQWTWTLKFRVKIFMPVIELYWTLCRVFIAYIYLTVSNVQFFPLCQFLSILIIDICKMVHHMKGRMQERPLDFSLKSKMAKTAPNFTCQFVCTCGKLPCTYFPLFPLCIPEIKYAKTLACHSPRLLKLLCYTILLALIFF